MPQVVACPRCSVAVAVASSAVARLRCPVCQQEFAPPEAPPDALASPVRREPQEMRPAPSTKQVTAAPRSTGTVASTTASARSGGGWLSNLVGVVGGGFLGLAAGYYLLNFFGGPRYDFLSIPLPGVAHTQPGWNAPGGLSLTAPETASAPVALASPTPVTVEVPDEASSLQPAPPLASVAVAPTATPPEQSGALALAEPAAESRPDVPGPRQAPRYTSDDLSEALAVAQAALGCPNCNSTGFVNRVVVTGTRQRGGRTVQQESERQFTCEVCHGRPALRLTQEVYLQLCHLAEVATFVEIEPGDTSLWNRKEGIRQVLLDAAGEQERSSALGRLAGHWLENRQRGADGILLAGTVRDVARQGPFYLTRVVLFGLPKEVTVVSAARSPFQARDRVLIAGSIVDAPAENLAGYEGSEPQVVWGGLPLRLPNDAL